MVVDKNRTSVKGRKGVIKSDAHLHRFTRPSQKSTISCWWRLCTPARLKTCTTFKMTIDVSSKKERNVEGLDECAIDGGWDAEQNNGAKVCAF